MGGWGGRGEVKQERSREGKEETENEDRSRGRAEESGCTVVAKETEKMG